MPRATGGTSSGTRSRGGNSSGNSGDRGVSSNSNNKAPPASALKTARWPDAAPFDNEEHFFSVIVGNSHLHWAFHNDLKEGMKPALFWRTPPLVRNDLQGGSAEALSRHLPQYAHDYIFGSHGDATLANAERQSQKRPVRRLTVYICSVVAEQEGWLFQLWSCIPSRVFKLQASDFFSASQGCYEGMSCDRLATLRGAAHLYGHPALVLDAGTAATYTCTDSTGMIAGGGIGLGMGRTLLALHEQTGALPHISIDEVVKKVAAAKSSRSPISAFARSNKDAIIVDLLATFAKKGQFVIREWLARVGVPQLTREDTANSVETIDAAAAATINDDTHKTNDDRQVLITGGDGEIWNSVLQPNHSNILADEANLLQAWVDSRSLTPTQSAAAKSSSSAASVVKMDTSEEDATDKSKDPSAADAGGKVAEAEKAAAAGDKDSNNEKRAEGKEAGKPEEKAEKSSEEEHDAADKQAEASTEKKTSEQDPATADSNGGNVSKPNETAGVATDASTSETDGKSSAGSKPQSDAKATENGGNTPNKDAPPSEKSDVTSKEDVVDMTRPGTKDEGASSWKNPGYKVAYMKHLIHYGIASVILDKMRQRRISSEAEMREAEANDHQQFMGQRVAKKFKQVDSQGDDVFRGTVVGIQKLADKSQKERSKSGESANDGEKFDADGDDWFLIHYDDDDREHVSRTELQEMMTLFYEVGEKDKDVPNARKRARHSKDQDKKEKEREDKEEAAPKKDKAEKDGRRETPTRGRAADPDNAAPVSSRGRKRKVVHETVEDVDDEDEEEQPPKSAKKRTSDGDAKARGAPRAEATPRNTDENSTRSARKRGRDLAVASEAETPSKKSGLEKNPKDYLHTRVCKTFDGSLYFGTITNYVDEDSSDDEDNGGLWHVDYDDGDEEDYDERDLRKALKLYAKNRRKDKNPVEVVELDNTEEEAQKKGSSDDSRKSKGADDNKKSKEDDDKSKEDDDKKKSKGADDKKSKEDDDKKSKDADETPDDKESGKESSKETGETEEEFIM